MRLSERFSPLNFITCAVPAVNQWAFCAVELFVKCRVGAFEELKFLEPARITIEETGVGLEVFWATDDPREFSGRGRSRDAVEGEEGVRKAAEVDAGALAKFHPIGGGENF